MFMENITISIGTHVRLIHLFIVTYFLPTDVVSIGCQRQEKKSRK